MGDRYPPAAVSTSADALGEDGPGPKSKTGRGVEEVHLWIGDNRVAVRCQMHPDFDESRLFGVEREVSAVWVVGVLARHLTELNAPAEEPDEEEDAGEKDTETATGEGSPLDAFAQEVVALSRWAMNHNDGEPDNKWPTPLRLAVALALFNLEYLSDMGPGPGYTWDQAMVRLVHGMTHRPGDINVWFGGIRDALDRSNDKHRALWLPSIPTSAGSGETMS